MDGNVAEIIANFIDVVFQFAFLTIVLGKRKNMPAWVFGILAVILTGNDLCHDDVSEWWRGISSSIWWLDLSLCLYLREEGSGRESYIL